MSRRDLLKVAGTGGVAAAIGTIGVGVRTDSADAYEQKVRQQLKQSLLMGQGGRKPVVLPPPGSMDPAVHAVSDILFWSDQLMEHALFLAMFLPGDELAPLRQQAVTFQRSFAEHLGMAQRASIDRDNYRQLIRQTVDQVLPLIYFKFRVEEAQRRGEIRSLVWPTFAAHIRAEAERFTGRLDQLARGDAGLDFQELAQFWTRIMEEHAAFTAALLDPSEQALMQQALATAAQFRELRMRGADVGTLFAAVEGIIHFKETAEVGVETAQIQSIIHPALADHVRREAVKFQDELSRAAGLPGGAQPTPRALPRTGDGSDPGDGPDAGE